MSREMKQSGVPWLKDIPIDWNVERGKNVLVLQKRPVRDDDEVVTCFRDGEVILRSLRRTEGFTMSDKEIGYQGINQGDIVIHGMDGFAGAMGVSKSTGKGSPVLIVCTPKYDAIPQYLIYYLRALAMTDVFIALATGIRERSCDLRWNKISELEFILPSSTEQQRIAEFLDRKCAEVDEMIGLQEQIIEELKAYKQSVITEAVTKGLNPDAPMKDSGIEWIGEIPEHWETIRVKYIADVQGRVGFKGYTKEDLVDAGEGAYTIGGKHITTNVLNLDDAEYISWEKYYESPEIMVNKGDIVFAQRGTLGRAAYIDREIGAATINPSLVLIKNIITNAKYLHWYLISSSMLTEIDLLNTSTAVPMISQFQINNIYVPHSPINEQEAIAEYLNTKCTEIDNLISIKLSKIDSLKEYKKSIIYEYVTGKKEVTE